MARQTPFDTGERYEAKLWYPDRSDPDTYGKVDFEDDSGGTSLTVYVARKDGQREIHVYDHDDAGYTIEIDDRDVRVVLPELDWKLGTDQVQGMALLGDLAGVFRQLKEQGWTKESVQYVTNQVWWE